jgi:hypothetical protein
VGGTVSSAGTNWRFQLFIFLKENRTILLSCEKEKGEMRRFLLGILWCLMFSSCSNPAVTTTTVPASPTPIPTVTVQPTNTALPSNILDRASLSGLSPEEIVFFYLEIRSYVESDDIGALANKIRFPLAICGLQHGDVIETKDEFIEKYGYAFGDEWKPFFLKSDLGRVTVHEYNIQASGINFSGSPVINGKSRKDVLPSE